MELQWLRRTLPPKLNSDEIHIWAVPLDVEPSISASYIEWLSLDERQRAERFLWAHVRRRFVAAHGALRQLLGQYLAIEPADVAVMTDGGGKPRIGNSVGANAICDLRFNLSHSGPLALVAIASGSEVGVDVEQVRSVNNIERLARRYFHAVEAGEVLTAKGDQRDQLFMHCWTAKEAVVKAYGSGIGGGLNLFRVPLEEAFSGFVDLSALPRPFTNTNCWVTRIVPCDGYSAACALIGEERTIGYFSFAP